MTTRRLAAIASADVVGYSRMIGEDEIGTLRRLRRLRRDIIDPLVAEHGGRIFKTTGDGVLAEFPSTMQALSCALAVQERMRGDAIKLRIGIHQGDVVVGEDDLFGDGVNVAARLESLAEPGGICVSARVREDAMGKIPLQVEDLGPRELKNIAHPVHAFRVRCGDADRPALALPDKPSIAVLPFQNMSGDAEQEYFADGMADEIITGLSRVGGLFVIARNSAFTYKGRSADVKQVGRELGVRYVLEGSIRRAGSQVRIIGQLVEAETGYHLWADRFDGALSDIFGLQDRVTAQVIGAIAPSVRAAEIERARRKPTESLGAYDLYLRALPGYYAMTKDSNESALQCLEQALALDAEYAAAAALAAMVLIYRTVQGWAEAPGVHHQRIQDLARHGIRHSPNDPETLAMAARALAYATRNPDEAIHLVNRAATLNPNSATILHQRGWIFWYAGRARAAVAEFEHSFRIDPLDPMAYSSLTAVAGALLLLGATDAAIAAATRSVRQNPNFVTAWRTLATALGLAGRIAEAQAAIERLLELRPDHTISGWKRWTPMCPAMTELYVNGLRAAGLPE